MSFGFPGANTSFENHNVSEESFWPSFTDIMMVIVMVFLLVTVSVILNNYHLIDNLKKSIQAEQLAAAIAEDTQVENSTLEEQLQRLQQRLAALNTQLLSAKAEVTTTKTQLLQSQQDIEALNTLKAEQQLLLDEKAQSLAALEAKSLKELEEKNTQIRGLQDTQKARIDELETAKQQLVKQTALLTQLQQREESSKNKYGDLQSQLATLQESLEAKSSAFDDLQKLRETEETQLLSVKGELESLDKKYQKLLRPARSSKDKFVVAVTYSKQRGRDQYRLRANPEGDYETVSRQQLYKTMASLQKKHGTDLYVKVIIPENSGLSYNDAWRFTNGMQKAYDYYYQEDDSVVAEDESDPATIQTDEEAKTRLSEEMKDQLDKAIGQ